MQKEIRDVINLVNAQKSTGPKTPAGKQRASMNAFKHGLTGNRLILQTHEHEAYTRLTTEITKDLTPKTELERQLVQKMIDCHTRLNRIAALDGNILNFGLTQNESDAPHDDALETIAAQCRSWIENADSFEKLGRYEARISRQLLQYTAELERLQANHREQARRDAWDARELAHRQAREAQETAKQAAAETLAEQQSAQRKLEAEQAEAEARQSFENKPSTHKSASFCEPRPKPTDYAPAA